MDINNLDVNGLSGCDLDILIKKIGYDNIVSCSNSDELLKEFDTGTLIDCICNDNDRDLMLIITELFSSNIELDSENEKALNLRMKKLLSEAC